ncbi:di/tricarboxylate transporter [Bacillus pakistanensis]|uniref:Di/tricarboxylate transporter n=1 Tax=Rossellomorea pakistanensis TaxID=992288 RepID=A0ABS2NGH5_9BACI|nr:SLC13 family permease [Bacillus pakistanensis]MBM7586940.1 di/tricarboxylate transporter [Bacillus pakistanensis]
MLEFYFVLFTTILMLLGLLFEIERPEVILASTVILYLVTGVISPVEATKGFSNEGVLTIGLLFILAGSIQKSGIVDGAFHQFLRNSSTSKHILGKLLFPISFLSAFMNNTPIVIAFTPMIRKWCEEKGLSPSKFLIPLSYATILGGTITIIGTSTNLVVHGLLIDEGLDGFSFFQPAIVGIPITIVGLTYLFFFSSSLLPDRRLAVMNKVEAIREYTGEILITKDFPYIGQSVEQARLRSLKGLYLVSILREQEQIAPVSNLTKLKEHDRLLFTGDITTITELQNKKGLNLQTSQGSHFPKNHHRLVEAVVSHYSSLLHKKIKDTNFRSRHNAAVIAVHRKNQRLKTKIGDIVLKPGDILLMVTGTEFNKNVIQNDFYFITSTSKNIKTKSQLIQGWFSIALLGFMILLVSLGFIQMVTAMSIATMLLIIFKVITPPEAKAFIQWNVLLLVASSFGIGAALINSGVANAIADLLIHLTEPIGMFAVFLSVYLLTNLFTEMMSNNAAAVLMFPIAIEIADKMKIDPISISIIVAIAASASFATPIGYQTNLIVYGPGGYQFKDFLKIGIPLNILVMITTVTIVYFLR